MNDPLFTYGEEQIAIRALLSLGWTPVDRSMELAARAIAEACHIREERGKAILHLLKERQLVEYRFEHEVANNLIETGHIIVNREGRWHRLETA